MYDPRRVFLNPFPNFTLGRHKRTVGVYLAGALVSRGIRPDGSLNLTSKQFALANWTFLDAAILSAHARPEHPTEPVLVHVNFMDWIPGICSLLGMIVVNVIDKDRVRGDEAGYGDSSAVWRARLVLFIGFALMAGGLAGSVVRHSSLSLCLFVSFSSPLSPLPFYFILFELLGDPCAD
jgi:hypothetical protein